MKYNKKKDFLTQALGEVLVHDLMAQVRLPKAALSSLLPSRQGKAWFLYKLPGDVKGDATYTFSKKIKCLNKTSHSFSLVKPTGNHPLRELLSSSIPKGEDNGVAAMCDGLVGGCRLSCPIIPFSDTVLAQI